MAITITSTTDSPEQVIAAYGGAPQSQEQVPLPAAVVPPAQTTPPSVPSVTNTPVPPAIPEVPPAAVPPVDTISTEPPAATPPIPGEQEGIEKHSGGFQKRIDKLTRKNYELQRQLDVVIRGGSNPSSTPLEKPNPDKFETNAEYIDAATQYSVQESLNQRSAKQMIAANEAVQAMQSEGLAESVAAFRVAQPDFDTVVNSVADVPASDTLKRLIVESEIGGPLMYELAKDRNELLRLNTLSDIQLVKAIGVMEHNISSRTTSVAPKPQIPLSKAPAPIIPVGGSTAGIIAEDPNTMSFDKYKEWRKKQK